MTSFSFFKYFDAFELDVNIVNFVYYGKTRLFMLRGGCNIILSVTMEIYYFVYIYILSMSSFFVPFKNKFNAALWCCLCVTSKKIKGAAQKKGDGDGMCKPDNKIKSIATH